MRSRSPSRKPLTVKLAFSSNSPAAPVPITEPFGPPPDTFCHAMGSSDDVEAEHPARTSKRRRRICQYPGAGAVTWMVPLKGGFEGLSASLNEIGRAHV